MESIATEKAKEFFNGEKPTPADFINVKSINGTNEKDQAVKYVLLTGGRIATVREGKGKDIERATMESSGDQSKYLTSMMAATTVIDGSPVSMYILSELSAKDYLAIQVAFAELNF